MTARGKLNALAVRELADGSATFTSVTKIQAVLNRHCEPRASGAVGAIRAAAPNPKAGAFEDVKIIDGGIGMA